MSNECDCQHDSAGFRRGETVTVRGLDEILATLDADAKLDGLPFMPEMVPYCGQTFRVFRRAEKTCVEGRGIRSLKNMVFLDGLRCDGSAHDGCQRGCLFFWNEAWLKAEESRGEGREERGEGCQSEINHQRSAINNPPSPFPLPPSALPTTHGDCFYCQSTELAAATTDFPPGKLRHYLRDFRLGEITLRQFAYVVWLAIRNHLWRLRHGQEYYRITGQQQKTLTAELNLQPGELVEIKSAAEIQATLDAQGLNRGLSFDPEMARYCGRRYRVAGPIRTIIAERTGKMVKLRNTVILEGLVCEGICSMNCPRANYIYWREIWLKRV